jgi:uncharacterized membrane protein YiaA
MIDESIILTFDGTIIVGLFVFYAFLVALAQRFEKAKEEVHISLVIRYLASVQLVFTVSAILVLVGLSNWALILSIIGLFLLVVYFVEMIRGSGFIQIID